MTRKIDVISGAYSQMRISGLTVEPTPEDLVIALSRLENMMAELEGGRNICTGYNFELEPDPDSLTNVDQMFWHMIQTNLAVRLIPDFNKDVPATLINQANASLSTAGAASAAKKIQDVIYPRRMPRGSGNTFRFNRLRRYQRQQEPAPNSCATNDLLVGEINAYSEPFSAYLNENESIDSFTITADSGLRLVSSANNSPVIDYTVEAVSNSANGTWQQVKIEIETSEGRKEIRVIDFNIESSDTVAS